MIVNNQEVNCVIINGDPIIGISIGDDSVYLQSAKNLENIFLENFTLSQIDNMIVG